MRYFGGKTRIASQITNYLSQFSAKDYYEPFVGAMNIISHLNNNFDNYYCSDICEDLILLYQGLQNNTFSLPDNVTLEEYKDLRNSEPSALRGFAAFGCSYSGKYFGGYAKDNTGRNYCLNAKNSLLKKLPFIKKSNFSLTSYKDINPLDSVIYCDPPYIGTTKYDYRKDMFNHDEFWQVMRKWSKDNIVIISEYSAPEDFTCVLEIKTKLDVRNGLGQKEERTEKLFQYSTS
jgi:DNA adenine methylase